MTNGYISPGPREELYAHAARHLIDRAAAAALDAWVRYVEGKRAVLRRAHAYVGAATSTVHLLDNTRFRSHPAAGGWEIAWKD